MERALVDAVLHDKLDNLIIVSTHHPNQVFLLEDGMILTVHLFRRHQDVLHPIERDRLDATVPCFNRVREACKRLVQDA